MMYAGFPNEVVVIEEENHERRFTAKIVQVGERYRGSMHSPVMAAKIVAGNGDFAMVRPQRDFTQVSASTWQIVLPAEEIQRHGGQGIRVGRIRFFSQFAVGEDVRVYAKTPTKGERYGARISVQRRLTPDWYVASTNAEAETVTLRQKDNGYLYRLRYEPIVVQLSQLLRDVNDNLRAYIDAKVVVLITEPITEGDHEVPMSHDRVEFVLGPFAAGHTGARAAVRAAMEAFNLTTDEGNALYVMGRPPTTFRVRPSQFARFLILRNNYGGVNDFKGLDPKLVPEVVPPTVMDVASRQNKVEV